VNTIDLQTIVFIMFLKDDKIRGLRGSATQKFEGEKGSWPTGSSVRLRRLRHSSPWAFPRVVATKGRHEKRSARRI
jgi:hypothetical protein